jgi:hypothetical protein
MGIYNGVWVHLFRRYIKGEREIDESSKLLPSRDNVNGYPSSSGSRVVSSTPDEDSLNR